jgi:hypothetical protein
VLSAPVYSNAKQERQPMTIYCPLAEALGIDPGGVSILDISDNSDEFTPYVPGAFSGKKHTEETKQRISNSIKGMKKWLGKKHKPETIQKIKERALLRENNNMLGKNHSIESRKLMSQKGKGKVFANNGIKNIKCYPHEIPDGYSRGRL